MPWAKESNYCSWRGWKYPLGTHHIINCFGKILSNFKSRLPCGIGLEKWKLKSCWPCRTRCDILVPSSLTEWQWDTKIVRTLNRCKPDIWYFYSPRICPDGQDSPLHFSCSCGYRGIPCPMKLPDRRELLHIYLCAFHSAHQHHLGLGGVIMTESYHGDASPPVPFGWLFTPCECIIVVYCSSNIEHAHSHSAAFSKRDVIRQHHLKVTFWSIIW